MRKFRGFNPDQRQMLAQRMGYNGDMAGFDGYLQADPKQASRYNNYVSKAQGHVDSGAGVKPTPTPAPVAPPPDNQLFTQGGRVVPPVTQAAPSAGGIPTQDANAPAPIATPQPIKNSGAVLPPQPTITRDMYPSTNVQPNPFVPPEQSSVLPAFAKGGEIKKPKVKPLTEAEKKARAERIEDRTWKQELSQPTEDAIVKPKSLVTPTQVNKVDWDKKQLIDKSSGQVGQIPQAKTDTVDSTAQGTTTTAEDPEATDAHTVDTQTAADEVKTAAEGMEAAQGTLSAGSQVEAATALPSANATVQGQLEGLMKQFEGGQTPAWAAGAIRMANTAMAARGMGSSSMAGAAINQAAMESAIQIAATDAATFSQFEMQNLNNRQQARLVNAQSFLQMDLANLNNRQQTELFKSQAIIQSLFTDQAAENATRQFNASSQNQTDQFFANLKSQVSTFNAAQANAMEQFNTGETNTTARFNTQQTNAMRQFNTQVKADIKKFNAQNRLVIDQSNAEWRRQIATVNNANQNEANRINAQAATGLTMAAFNNMWQQERDLMAYAFTAGENMQQRAHEVMLAKMGAELDQDLMEQQNRGALWEAAGSFVGDMFDGLF
jgi:hypothetical protein